MTEANNKKELPPPSEDLDYQVIGIILCIAASFIWPLIGITMLVVLGSHIFFTKANLAQKQADFKAVPSAFKKEKKAEAAAPTASTPAPTETQTPNAN